MKTINNKNNQTIETSLYDLQTKKPQNMDTSTTSCCTICGKKIKEYTKTKMIHLLINGNIVNSEESVINSQGFFPARSDCAKKISNDFYFNNNFLL